MAPAAGSGSDPLAELARLIGQNDPFSEFGRDGARRPAALQPATPEPRAPAVPANLGTRGDYSAMPAAPPPMPEAQGYAPPNYGRQPFGGASLATGGDVYQVEGEVPGYPAAHAGSDEDDGSYDPSKSPHGTEEDDFYDDVPPTRRRMGIMVIAGVFALAVLGTAGAFGYRALFGSSSGSAPPPVIKADTTPSKIVPAASSRDSQVNKLITDRVNERGLGEKLVSREEQPLEIKDKPSGIVFPQGQGGTQAGTEPPVLGSGIVGSEPKRVRTIAIHPEQTAPLEATQPTAITPPPAPPPARVTTTIPPVARPAAPPPPQQPPQQTAPQVMNNLPPAAEPEPAPAARPTVTRVAPPVRQAPAPVANNAPLSLSPDAPAPAPARIAPVRAAPPPTRTAAVAPTQTAPPPVAGGNGAAGGYAVQVSAQRSEAEAQAAFRSLQGTYPSQLGGKQPLIHKVDLGAKGIYYRAMVGPFGNANEASELCSSLKAAGGQCIVQKN